METSSLMQAAAGLVIYAGLAGAVGVGLAAAGAHGANYAALTPAAQFLILHAAAAVATVAVAARASHPSFFLVAALVLLIGVTLFSGDISVRTIWDTRLFPMAAPMGGTTMIVGWLILSAAGGWELLANRG